MPDFFYFWVFLGGGGASIKNEKQIININGAPYGKLESLWLGDLAGVSAICKEEGIRKANPCTCGQDWSVCVCLAARQPGRESNRRQKN